MLDITNDTKHRHPMVYLIYNMYFDKDGHVVSSYRHIAAALHITPSTVSGHMGRNRDLFPKQREFTRRSRSEIELDTNNEQTRQKRYRERQKAKKMAEHSTETRIEKEFARKHVGLNKNHLLGEKYESIFDFDKMLEVPLEKEIEVSTSTSDTVPKNPRPLIELANNECRYVVDDTENGMLMCGDRFESYPYCRRHAHLAFRAAPIHRR